MKIMVLNLPRSFSEDELAKLFKQYGNISSCDMVMDPKTSVSKGFGFVVMPQEQNAQAAIKALNGFVLKGNKLRVKAATE